MLNIPLLSFGATNEAVGVAPAITSVVDDGNQDSATVSITGDGTIQLYYRILGAASWTTGLTRTNSGDIVQTGLVTPNWYEFYATASPSGVESAPSNLVTAYIAGQSLISIGEAIVSILLADLNLVALIGNRVYPNYVPQGAAVPAVTYQRISGPRDHTFDGPSGLVKSRYQLNSWADTYGDMESVADAVRIAMDGFSGTIGGRVIQNIESDDETDTPVIKPGVDKLRRMGSGMDFNIHYNEATA